MQEDSPCSPAPDTAVTTVQALGTLQGLSHLGFPSLLMELHPLWVFRGDRGTLSWQDLFMEGTQFGLSLLKYTLLECCYVVMLVWGKALTGNKFHPFGVCSRRAPFFLCVLVRSPLHS